SPSPPRSGKPLLRRDTHRACPSQASRSQSSPDMESGDHDWPSEIIDMLRSAAEVAREAPAAAEAKGGGELRLFLGSSQIPHPKKAETGGEDSLFVCPHGSAAGVSDGVGEWEWRFGLNPRSFADELMLGAKSAAAAAANGDAGLSARDRAAFLLGKGYEATRSFGSATALIATLDSDASELGVANLGDSGLRVIRRHSSGSEVGVRIAHRTLEQQHSFNCPYQLSRLPAQEDFERLRSQGLNALVRAVQATGSSKQDLPLHADTYHFEIQEGDLLLLGTDGVFDNLHDHEVCQLAGVAMTPEAGGSRQGRLAPDPSKLAAAIAKAAAYRSQDQGARTPFGENAKEAGLYHVGGKMDDISVVAAWVVRA
ncbi:unnamed protein product, partial [Polarella glacialis]